MTTEEGVQTVCNGALECISKYHLEEPLYHHLPNVLFVPPQNPETSRDRTTRNEKHEHIHGSVTLKDISAKLDDLQRITATILAAVKLPPSSISVSESQ